MPTYTLDLSISAQDLETMEGAGENIVVAKPVGNPSSTPNVAWLSIKPLEGNQIVWTEEYAMYASTTQIQSGASIFQTSTTPYPAEDGVCYMFDASGTFPGQATGPQPVAGGSYSVLNDYTAQPSMTFGLTQSATTTSGNYHLSPLNAQAVPSLQQVVFTPFTTVWVWLEAQINSGVVITEVISKVAIVTFGGSVTTQALTYDATHGQFEPPANSSNVKLFDFMKYGGGRRARKLR
jgi:hypothetical protein